VTVFRHTDASPIRQHEEKLSRESEMRLAHQCDRDTAYSRETELMKEAPILVVTTTNMNIGGATPAKPYTQYEGMPHDVTKYTYTQKRSSATAHCHVDSSNITPKMITPTLSAEHENTTRVKRSLNPNPISAETRNLNVDNNERTKNHDVP